MREQFWLLPSGEDGRVLRATVFRPDDPVDEKTGVVVPQRHPVIVVNHGTSEATRLAVAMPVYYWLSRWFVEQGYVVVLPQRRGHGATGGLLSEAIGNCANPDHYLSGLVAADDIAAVVTYIRQQDFAEPDNIYVAGISTGGWASIAYAARNPEGVRGIINFSGGRGGHAAGIANAVCSERRLIESARRYGETARIPTIWFYSSNDSYFGPDLARSLAKVWNEAGGSADLHVLAAYGSEGHNIVDDRAGWELWADSLARFLKGPPAPSIAATEGQPTTSVAASMAEAANYAPASDALPHR